MRADSAIRRYGSPFGSAEKGDWLHNRLYLSAHQTAIGCGACPLFQQASFGLVMPLSHQ
jgi:hypothetical protein